MSQQFDLRHLAALDALAVERHFGRAADRLHVARPALSRTIQQLERRLGVGLVDRTTRSVRLTPAGLELAARARRLLDDADRAAVATLDVAAGRSGRLRIGFTGPSMIGTLPALLRRMRRASPELRLDVRELPTTEQLARLVAGELDVAFFLEGAPVPAEVETTAVVVERAMIGVAADHPVASADGVRLADLADETLILFPRARNPTLYDELVDLVSGGGRRAVRVEEASSRSVAAGLVAAGLGVSTFTASMAGLCGPDVRLVPQVAPERWTTVLMGWPRDRPTPLLQHLGDGSPPGR
ncbi:MAG: LysR family transcriptional regulator [Actinomycetota bacterium]